MFSYAFVYGSLLASNVAVLQYLSVPLVLVKIDILSVLCFIRTLKNVGDNDIIDVLTHIELFSFGHLII